MGSDAYLAIYVPNIRACKRQFDRRVITGDRTAAHTTGAKIKDFRVNITNVIFMGEDQIIAPHGAA